MVVRCPGCTGEVQVPGHLHGTAVLCPLCQRRFTAPDAPPVARETVTTAKHIPPPTGDIKYCVECGSALRRKAVVCPSCGVPQPNGPAPANTLASAIPPRLPATNNIFGLRIAAGVLGILLGTLGVHKFILGYVSEGIIMICLTMTGIGALFTWCAGVAEGVIYLTKSDDEFKRTYIDNKKGWF